MSQLLRVLMISSLVGTLALLAAGCGATDNAKLAQAGLGTASYLKAIQPQLTKYSGVVSTLAPGGPPTAAKSERLSTGADTMRSIAKELDGIEASKDYAKAHAELISSVKDSAAALDDMAAASTKGDAKAYMALVSGEYADSQTRFASAMQAATQPIQDAAPTS